MKKKHETSPRNPEVETSDDVDQEGPNLEPDSEIPLPDAEIVKLREDNELLLRQIERAKADLANIRKRHRKELDEARSRALEAFSSELLPVLDNFHLALSAHHDKGPEAEVDVQSMIDGLMMVRSLLTGALERHGLVEIAALGKDFDPNLHEAIGIDSQSDAPPGKVTQIVQQGYIMGDKVLRASRVLVSGEAKDTDKKEDPPEDSTEA